MSHDLLHNVILHNNIKPFRKSMMDMAIVLATFAMDLRVAFPSVFIQHESFLEVLSFLLYVLLLLQQAIELARTYTSVAILCCTFVFFVYEPTFQNLRHHHPSTHLFLQTLHPPRHLISPISLMFLISQCVQSDNKEHTFSCS
jgi:hypothetical protein